MCLKTHYHLAHPYLESVIALSETHYHLAHPYLESAITLSDKLLASNCSITDHQPPCSFWSLYVSTFLFEIFKENNPLITCTSVYQNILSLVKKWGQRLQILWFLALLYIFNGSGCLHFCQSISTAQFPKTVWCHLQKELTNIISAFGNWLHILLTCY